VSLGILTPRFESGNDTLKAGNLMLQDVELMLSAINLDQERVSDLSSSAACGTEIRLEPNIIWLAIAAFAHVMPYWHFPGHEHTHAGSRILYRIAHRPA
jgi:hypothetical protein